MENNYTRCVLWMSCVISGLEVMSVIRLWVPLLSMNIQVARTTSEKLPESSNDKFLPSTNELRLTIKCGRKKKNVSFIRRSMAATLLTHSQWSADGLGFRLPCYQSRDGRTSRSIKRAAWGKGRGIKLVIRGKTRRERVQGSLCETSELVKARVSDHEQGQEVFHHVRLHARGDVS